MLERVARRRVIGKATAGALTLLFAVSLAGAQDSAPKKTENKSKQTKTKSAPPAAKPKGKTDAKMAAMPQRIALVFPTDAKGGVSDQLSDMVTDVERGRLRATGAYRTIYFLRSLPTIKRAVTEQTLSAADVDKPFDKDEKIKRLCRTAGYDLALVSSIDDYQYDADKKQVTLVMSARLIDFSGDKPVIRSVGDTGSNPGNLPKTADEVTIALAAARELSEKLMDQLLKPAKSGDKPAVQKSVQ